MASEFLMPSSYDQEGCGLSVLVFGLDRNINYDKILIYLKNDKENRVGVKIDTYNTLQTESVSFHNLEKDRYYTVVAELYYEDGNTKTIESMIPSVEVSGYGIALMSSSDSGSGGQPTGNEIPKPSTFTPPTYGQIDPIYTTIKEQGIYETCVANSLSTAMSIFKVKQTGIKEDYSVGYIYGSDNRPNEEYMYFEEAIQKCQSYGSPRWELYIGVQQDNLFKAAAVETFNSKRSDTIMVQNAYKQRFGNYELVNFYDCDRVAYYINTYGYFMFNFKIPDNFYTDENGIVLQPEATSTFDNNNEVGGSSQYSNANHSMALIGLTEIDGVPYWIAQNSWGESWGQSGLCFLPCDWGYDSSEYWALESYGITPGSGYTNNNPTAPYNLSVSKSDSLKRTLSWQSEETGAQYIVLSRETGTAQWFREDVITDISIVIDVDSDTDYDFMVITMKNYYCSSQCTDIKSEYLTPGIEIISCEINTESISCYGDYILTDSYDITNIEFYYRKVGSPDWILTYRANQGWGEYMEECQFGYRFNFTETGYYEIKIKAITENQTAEVTMIVNVGGALNPKITSLHHYPTYLRCFLEVNVSDATRKLYIKPPSDNQWTMVAATGSGNFRTWYFDDHPPTYNVYYDVKIVAEYNGDVEESDVVTMMLTELPTLSTPQNLTVSRINKGFSVSWDKVNNATDYFVLLKRGYDNGRIGVTISDNSLIINDALLENLIKIDDGAYNYISTVWENMPIMHYGVTYNIRLRANYTNEYTIGDCLIFETSESDTTLGDDITTAPARPTITSVSASDGIISGNWNLLSTDGNISHVYLTLYKSDGTDLGTDYHIICSNLTSGTFSFPKIDSGGDYIIKAASVLILDSDRVIWSVVDSGDDGSADNEDYRYFFVSDVISVILGQLQIRYTRIKKGFIIEWDSLDGASSYNLQILKNGEVIGNPNGLTALSYTINDLDYATEYTIQMQSVGGDGVFSPWTTIAAITAPSCPIIAVTSHDTNTVNGTWTLEDPNSNFTYLYVTLYPVKEG